MDPRHRKYASYSPYVYVANSPLSMVDDQGDTLRVAGRVEDALDDVRSLVPEEYRHQIQIVDGQVIWTGVAGIDDLPEELRNVVDEDEPVRAHAGATLLLDLIVSGNVYVYYAPKVGDMFLTSHGWKQTEARFFDPKNIGTKDEAKKSWAIINVSSTPRGGEEDPFKPARGTQALVAVHQGTFSYTLGGGLHQMQRHSVVFHELKESYLRTDDGMSYKRAHAGAIKQCEDEYEPDMGGLCPDGFSWFEPDSD